MDVAIVTDASSDLPAALAAERGVAVANLGYTVGGKRYTTLGQRPDDFLASLDKGGGVEIGGVEADDFETAYREAATRASHLICLCQSVGSSFTRVSAEVAARRLQDDGVTVDVISPGRSTAALAAMALGAADVARGGAGAAKVTAWVERAASGADTYLIAPSLDQLERAGQLSIVQSQSGVGDLDDGTPLFRLRGRLSAVSVEDDAPAAEAALIEAAVHALNGQPGILVATHARAQPDAQRLLDGVTAAVDVRASYVMEAGPTISGLLGRGSYGLGFCIAAHV